MDKATLSSKFQLVVPKKARERLSLRPGTRFTVITKGGVIYLIPERPLRAHRGMLKGIDPRGLRDKKDRL
jgi:AbrB family looped-hinge helix DNA binding protein